MYDISVLRVKHLTVVQDVCWRLMTSLIKASHIIPPDL